MNGSEFLKRIEKEMRRCIVGYDDVVILLTTAILSNGHVLLEGAPGLGKTTLAKNFCNIFGLNFSRIQLTPDTMPADIIGFYYFNQKKSEFELKKGPIFSNIILADEINRASPKTQSALLEAMQEGSVSIEGNHYELPKPFMVVATKNPLESEGVYALPEAQMDRFMFKVELNHPKQNVEFEMLKRKHDRNFWEAGKGISKDDLRLAIIGAKSVIVSDKILEYICKIVDLTRKDSRLLYGASPRASEHLLLASKSYAYLNGRKYVIPDDVKYLANYVIPHRIKIKAEYNLEGLSEKDIVKDIIGKIKVPK